MSAPLALDARQRAMLAEMGVRVWSPAPAATPALPAAADDVPAAARTPAVPSTAAPTVTSTVAPTVARPPNAPGAPPATLASAAAATDAAAPVAGAQVARAPAAAPTPSVVAQMDWAALQASVAQCSACGLCSGRRHTVFGIGDHGARWMVVGEAPGEQEDARGEPFVGPAGQLLDAMLAAIGLSRQAGTDATQSIASESAPTRATGGFDAKKPGLQPVYIANVLKCRPPGNRNPQPDEIAQCEPYLRRQVALLRPRLILAMGRFAVQTLLQTGEPIGRLRGRVHRYAGVPVIVTYHPAYLLRNLVDKARAWDDLVLALDTAAALPPDDSPTTAPPA